MARGIDRPELGYEPDDEFEVVEFVITSKVIQGMASLYSKDTHEFCPLVALLSAAAQRRG